VRGVLAVLWWGPVGLSLIHLSQLIGLRLKKRHSIYSVSLAVGGLMVGLPAFVGWVLKDMWLLSGPARVVSAGLMLWAKPWELVLSLLLWSLVAIGLHVMLVQNFRRWGGTVDG